MVMNIKPCIKLIAVLLFILGLFGCSAEQEAEKLGFANVSEMNVIHNKGWHTKAQYDSDIALINNIAQDKKQREEAKALELAQSLKLTQESKQREEALAYENKQQEDAIADELARTDEGDPNHDDFLKGNDWFVLSKKNECTQGTPLTMKKFFLDRGVLLTEKWSGKDMLQLYNESNETFNFIFIRGLTQCKIAHALTFGQ